MAFLFTGNSGAVKCFFDEHDGGPNVIGKSRAAAVFVGLAQAEFGDVQRVALTEGLEDAVEEDLHLTFFVAGDVLLTPRGESGEFFPAQQGEFLHKANLRHNPAVKLVHYRRRRARSW